MRTLSLRRGFFASLFAVMAAMLPLSTTAQALDGLSQEFMDGDSTTTCDAIGWNAADTSFLGDYDLIEAERMFACVGSRGTLAECGTFESKSAFISRPSNQVWFACTIVTVHGGSSGTFTASMFDFSLVDAEGRKYDYDLTAQSSLSTSSMFPTATLQAGQNVFGIIAFALPTSITLPLFLEVAPLVDLSLGENVAYVVIPTLVSVDDAVS